MASRKLVRLDIDPVVKQHLEKTSIKQCKDLLSRTELELMQILDLPLPLIRETVLKVSSIVAPKPMSLLSIREQRVIPTTLSFIDTELRGGIHSGIITEIVGPAGVGKTQFSHTLTVLASVPPSASTFIKDASQPPIAESTLDDRNSPRAVLYIDSESTFSAERVVEISRARFPAWSTIANLTALTQNILVVSVGSSAELLTRLDSLEEVIIERGVVLLVLDSLASLARRDFDAVIGGGRSELQRHELLAKVATKLKYFAEEFQLPVVVTNQVTTTFGAPSEFGLPAAAASTAMPTADQSAASSYVTAALGTLWAHCVNTRLVLDFGVGEISGTADTRWRRMTIAKCPLARVCSVVYEITAGGLVQAERDGVPIVMHSEGNFWDSRITPRPTAAPRMAPATQQTGVMLY